MGVKEIDFAYQLNVDSESTFKLILTDFSSKPLHWQ